MAEEESQQIGQDEIEKLLAEARGDSSAPAPSSGEAPPAEQAKPEPPAEAADQPSQASAESEEDGDRVLQQSEIEALLQQSTPAKPAAPAKPAPSAPSRQDADESDVNPADVEMLFNQAEAALASFDQAEHELPEGAQAFSFEELRGAPPSEESATLELVRDVELDLKIELGRTHMHLEDVLRLRKGSVVPLDKLAGDPVDIYVNGRLVAHGEVLVMNDNFCIRVAELVAPESGAA